MKSWDWIKKGVPIRIEIGPRDLAQGMVALSRRDQPHKERSFVSAEELPRHPLDIGRDTSWNARPGNGIPNSTRKSLRQGKILRVFHAGKSGKPEIHGGFALTYWNGSAQLEEEIKDVERDYSLYSPREQARDRLHLHGPTKLPQAVWAKSCWAFHRSRTSPHVFYPRHQLWKLVAEILPSSIPRMESGDPGFG